MQTDRWVLSANHSSVDRNSQKIQGEHNKVMLPPLGLIPTGKLVLHESIIVVIKYVNA